MDDKEKDLSYLDEIEVEDINEIEEEVEDTKTEGFNWLKEILSWVKVFIVAIFIAVILNNFIILNATVPTGSMENTIAIGDRMIGNRLSYVFGEPQRGDVVIFKYPDNEEQLFVKRIIGLPGETVKIDNGKVYINNSETPLDEPYIKEAEWGDNQVYQFEVPADSYFMMGDNRNNSNDSRFWNNHYVHEDKILAKAVLVYWPYENFETIKGAEY